MKLSKKTFQVLDALDRQEISTQRQLAEHAGISLGQVNYVLKSLLEKGMVKIGNFRKNPRKIGYAYLLTPKGIEAKSKLAVSFVTVKLNEYNSLRQRLGERLHVIDRLAPRKLRPLGRGQGELSENVYLPYREAQPFMAGRLQNKGHVRFIFVGPAIIKEFVHSIIEEKALNLILVHQCTKWEHLKGYDPESFDIALLFDGDSTRLRKIEEATGISAEKLLPLW
ncbi:MAG: MarR family EPS-associated transcriptional regulator [Desulfobacterales bacterium]|nr:MarR family EPS-associated transcriptional regulator [Desulfobacterales bacterium]